MQILKPVCIAASILLGVDKIGVFPIVGGHDTGFHWSVISERGAEAVTIGHVGGNLTCWVRVNVRTDLQRGPLWRARLSNGDILDVETIHDHEHEWRLNLTAASEKHPDGFVWPSGVDIILYADGLNGPVSIDDWEVFGKADRECDRASTARWRDAWFYISLASLVLALTGAFWPQNADNRQINARSCARRVINSVKGKDPAETRIMRHILKQVIFGDRERALQIPGVPKNKALQKWFQARRQFRSRMARLIKDLQDVTDRAA